MDIQAVAPQFPEISENEQQVVQVSMDVNDEAGRVSVPEIGIEIESIRGEQLTVQNQQSGVLVPVNTMVCMIKLAKFDRNR